MEIRRGRPADSRTLGELALLLWPAHTLEELEAEIRELLISRESAFFLAWSGETAVGFAQCQLRRDYVEGTKSSPVGYLEGIYVREDARRQGIAGRLLAFCENWAREQGCTEFASDCELTNTWSLAFHLHVGFTESNRIICLNKKL